MRPVEISFSPLKFLVALSFFTLTKYRWKISLTIQNSSQDYNSHPGARNLKEPLSRTSNPDYLAKHNND